MIEPDAEDWTRVLDQPCPEGGYDAAPVDRRTLGAAVRDDAAGWQAILASPGSGERPTPDVCSPLEYARQVREVDAVMGRRLALTPTEDHPRLGRVAAAPGTGGGPRRPDHRRAGPGDRRLDRRNVTVIRG